MEENENWTGNHSHNMFKQEYPDALLRERAQHFGVHTSAIWYANKQMKLTRKKNSKV
jgi:Transposase